MHCPKAENGWIALRVPEKIKKELIKLAQEDYRTLSSLVLKVLTDYVKQKS